MIDIINELKTGMKMEAGAEKDARLIVVRELKNKENDLYPEKSDAKLQHKWLSKMKAERTESIHTYESNGRADLAGKEKGELAAIDYFLGELEKDMPKKMTEEEIRAVIQQLKETNANLNIGQVMKHFKTNFADRSDNAAVSRICREVLA